MNEDIQSIKQRFGIIGNHIRLNEAIRVARQVAPTDMSVLIMGESGVGKEFFPRIIHSFSLRKSGKFIAVNCGAIPEGTIDSELFGHRKGSFTGAINDRKGYFEEANGGTIFLDEVGELPLSTQARLLRVLEGGDFIPVGSSTPQKTDVRIVAATNVKLYDAIREGKFREDLFYRLSTVPIEVPALRERAEDVPLLFRKFASESASKYNIPPIDLTPEAAQTLMQYRWPGNVRELKNITDRLSLLEESRLIDKQTLTKYLQKDALIDQHPTLFVADSQEDGKHSFANEREILYKVLFDLNSSVTLLKKQMAKLQQNIITENNGNETRRSNLPTTIKDPSVSIKEPIAVAFPTSTRPKKEHNVAEDVTEEVHYPAVESNKEASKHEAHKQNIEDLDGMSLKDIERLIIIRTLERHALNKTTAAEELGISERTLYRKLKEYGLDKDL